MCKQTFTAQQINSNLSIEPMPGEAWAEIPDTGGCYSISSYGRVRSEPRFFRDGDHRYNSGRIMAQVKKGGRRFSAIRDEAGAIKSISIARTVYLAFIGNLDRLEFVVQKDNDKDYCAVWNLVKVSKSDLQREIFSRTPTQQELFKKGQTIVKQRAMEKNRSLSVYENGILAGRICKDCGQKRELSDFWYQRLSCKNCMKIARKNRKK